MRPRPFARAVLAAALALPACGPAIRQASSEVPKAATPALVDSGLKTMEDPRTRARLAAVLATPEMQRAIEEVSSGLSRGVIDALSDAQIGDRVRAATVELARAVVSALAVSAKDLEPVMQSVARATVDAVMREAASPANEAASRRLAAAVSAEVVRAISTEMPKTLGPAMRDAIQTDVTPSLAAMARSPDLRDALGDASRDVAKNAVLGSNDALAYLAERGQKQNAGGPLGAFGEFFAARTWLLVLLVAAAVFAVFIAWFARDRAEARRYRDRTERRAAETAALVRAIDAARDTPGADALLDALKRALARDDADEAREPAARRRHRPRHA